MSITKEFLRTEIEQNQKTFRTISKETGVNADKISKLCKEYGIKIPYKNLKKEEKSKIIRTFLTKEFLEENLVIKGYSCLFIVQNMVPKEYPVSVITVQKYAHAFGIKTPTIKDSANSSLVRDRFRKTCFEKYGENHPSKVQRIKDQKEAKALERYGVSNVFQSEEIKEKSHKTLFSKYGVHHPMQLAGKASGTRSKIHQQVEKMLLELNVNFRSEVAIFRKFNEVLNKSFNPIVDILIEEAKLIIEVQGDKYHANPEIYKAEDVITGVFGSRKITASVLWERDAVKKKHLEDFGYHVLYIWEKDLRSNKQKTRNLIRQVYKKLLNNTNAQ